MKCNWAEKEPIELFALPNTRDYTIKGMWKLWKGHRHYASLPRHSHLGYHSLQHSISTVATCCETTETDALIA